MFEFRCRWLVWLVLPSLTGCVGEPALPRQLDTYGSRLAAILDVDAPLCCEIPPVPPLPQLSAIPPELSIDLGTFYQLRACQVYALVAQRNTALGKVQAASQRYLYEVALLRGLSQCRDAQDDVELRGQINHWLTQKYQHLPITWAQLMQSMEIKHSLAQHSGFIKGEADGVSHSLAGLQYLTTIKDAQQTVANEKELETQLQNLQNVALPARMFRTSRLLAFQLERINAMLSQHAPACSTPAQKQQATYMLNVFRLFLINEIQPIAAKLQQYHAQHQPLLRALLADNPHLAPWQTWLDERYQEDFANFQQQWQQHIRWWQAFLDRCQLRSVLTNT